MKVKNYENHKTITILRVYSVIMNANMIMKGAKIFGCSCLAPDKRKLYR